MQDNLFILSGYQPYFVTKVQGYCRPRLTKKNNINRNTMKPIVIISTTLEKKQDAERLANLLLDRKLIACAQVLGPITSIYRWQGVTTSATEFALSLKTTPACSKTVKSLLCENHPYDLPEIIVQEIGESSDDYANWLYGEVRQC